MIKSNFILNRWQITAGVSISFDLKHMMTFPLFAQLTQPPLRTSKITIATFKFWSIDPLPPEKLVK